MPQYYYKAEVVLFKPAARAKERCAQHGATNRAQEKEHRAQSKPAAWSKGQESWEHAKTGSTGVGANLQLGRGDSKRRTENQLRPALDGQPVELPRLAGLYLATDALQRRGVAGVDVKLGRRGAVRRRAGGGRLAGVCCRVLCGGVRLAHLHSAASEFTPSSKHPLMKCHWCFVIMSFRWTPAPQGGT